MGYIRSNNDLWVTHRKNYYNFVLIFIVVFLSILLLNSLSMQRNILTLEYFPTVTREDEPFTITASVRNTDYEPRTYRVSIFVDGQQVLATESRLDASTTQSFTYTRASPELGSAVRIYAEALNQETGVKFSDIILVPQSPPEVWLSFAAFSSFATSLTSSSSSAMSSSFTIRYYQNTMNISAPEGSFLSPINVGLVISIVLIVLLIFIEITDPSYGKLGRRVKQLRSKYGLLAGSLLMIFLGMVLTRIVMIIA